MHDLTFAKEMLDALNKKLKIIGTGKEITAIKASLSPMSHVKPEGLAETFKSLVKGTPFERVRLRIKTLQLGMRCDSCKKEFMIEMPTMSCPECRSSDIHIVYSKEFAVESVVTRKKA